MFQRPSHFRLALIISVIGSFPMWGAADSVSVDTPLTSAKAIRSLTSEQAAAEHFVRMEGVVLQGVRVRPQAIILWDGEESIYVEGRGVFQPDITPGDLIVLEGHTGDGTYAPVINATSVEVVGRAALPRPLKTTVSEVAAGGFDATWVELEAIVLSYVEAEPGPHHGPMAEELAEQPVLFLEIKGGDAQIQLLLEADIDGATLIDAKVRFTGICYSLHNPNRQFVRATMVVNGADFVEVVTPAPSVEDLPVTPINELLQFSQSGFSGHRVKVRGVVTHHEPGRTLWLQDGGRGLEVASNRDVVLSPGDMVEVVGFAEHGSYAPRLTNAEYRIIDQQDAPIPERIDQSEQTISQEANLIVIEGVLVDVKASPEVALFSMSWEGGTFQGVLVARPGETLPAVNLSEGSRLRLTGICTRVPQSWAPEIGIWRIEEFQVLLRSADDIEVIAPGPWLTEKRAIYLLTASAGVLLFIIVAIIVLSRRAIARRELERRMAEAEFSAILRERNRVARDIHDTLAQGLNAVSMQLELAKNTSGTDASQSNSHVKTAHEIVRSCIAEARESIWNMRSHVLDQTDLPGALEIVLGQLGAPHDIACRVEVEGRRRRLAPRTENDLLRVGQEAIANGLKHSGAKELVVRVVFMTNRIRLLVIDDGRGFDPRSARVTTSQFGLKGMRERVEQMPGSIEFLKRRGGGTQLVVEVGE